MTKPNLCPECGALLKNKERKHCSRSCSGKAVARRVRPKKTRFCKKCQTPTTNPVFCSKECFSNTSKAKIKKFCSNCNKSIDRCKYDLCGICLQRKQRLTIQAMTLQEFQNKESIANKHPSWRNTHIRNFCRSWNKDSKQECTNCGYSKHVEFCHIKAISSFPKTATLGEVNSPNNILILCPNCHWEFDNNLLKLEDIKSTLLDLNQ